MFIYFYVYFFYGKTEKNAFEEKGCNLIQNPLIKFHRCGFPEKNLEEDEV